MSAYAESDQTAPMRRSLAAAAIAVAPPIDTPSTPTCPAGTPSASSRSTAAITSKRSRCPKLKRSPPEAPWPRRSIITTW
jgi:hypothetical protein